MAISKIISLLIISLAVCLIVIRPFVLYDIGHIIFDGDYNKVNNSLQRLIKKQDSFSDYADDMEEQPLPRYGFGYLPVRILFRHFNRLFSSAFFLHVVRQCRCTVFEVCPNNSQHRLLSKFQV